MSKENFVYFLYQKDFAEKGNDRYFVYECGLFSEVDSSYIVNLEKFVVTHDYWLIVSSLYKKHSILPDKVLDINLLSRIVTGKKALLRDPQLWDISQTIKLLYSDQSDFDRYIGMYYRREYLNEETYMLFSHKLEQYTDQLCALAQEAGELSRFYAIELPLFNLLSKVASKGLCVSEKVLKIHKSNIKNDYYRELKKFSEKHNVLYEQPSDGDIKDKLRSLGYDVEKYSANFLINFLPSINDYTLDLKKLQKLGKCYYVFNNISSSAKKLNPIVDTHSTSTSRIYFKSPNIQNIPKRYRDIFIPDNGLQLSYIDYDQFEVGIMAALSADEKMKNIYTNMDAYIDLSTRIFGTNDYRKKSKILFLSYTYGMSIENIFCSVTKLGGNRKAAEKYFSTFDTFEQWKEKLFTLFEKEERISTVCGNYLNRTSENELTHKEKRSVVSQVVQGTGSYIFKSALLELSKQDGVEIVIPMHDAVLIQHPKSYDPDNAVSIFESTMTHILDGKINGKASIEEFHSNA